MSYSAMTVLPGRSAADVVKETAHREVQTVGTFWQVDDEERGVRFRAAHDIVNGVDVPRHRHTFEQVYFHLGGNNRFNGRDRLAGTFAYHPESVYYGPIEMVEGPLEMIVCQFPAPSGKLFGSNEEVARAMRGLREDGATVEKGIVVWPDGRRQDSTEAAFEWLMGGEVDYAPARYDEPIVVHAGAVPWVASQHEGVEVRYLGAFNERGPNARLLRLAPGASTPSGVSGAAQMRFVYEGSVNAGGREAGRVSALYYPPGTDYEPLVAGPAGAEVLVLQVQLDPGAQALTDPAV